MPLLICNSFNWRPRTYSLTVPWQKAVIVKCRSPCPERLDEVWALSFSYEEPPGSPWLLDVFDGTTLPAALQTQAPHSLPSGLEKLFPEVATSDLGFSLPLRGGLSLSSSISFHDEQLLYKLFPSDLPTTSQNHGILMHLHL